MRQVKERECQADVKAMEAGLLKALPQDISAFFSRSVPSDFELTAEEVESSRRYAAKRLSSFVAGRFAASEALRQLGQPRASIPTGASREPVWPPSVVGSITHTNEIAGAVVARRSRYIGLGLDLEHLQPLADIASHICTAKELRVASTDIAPAHYLSILFSAKESVYKCLWPVVRQFIPFQSVGLELDFHAFRFKVAWHADVSELATLIEGHWVISNHLVATVAIARHE